MKRFLLIIALVAIVAPALLLANPQDTLWVKNTGRTIEALAVSPDSKYIVVGEANPNAYVSVRDIQNGNELFQLPGWSYFYNMLFSKNGKYLLYGFGDTIRIVDCSTWTVINTLRNAGFINRFTYDENHIIFTNTGDDTKSLSFSIYNIETGNIEKQITQIECPLLTGLKTVVPLIAHPSENKFYFVSEYDVLYELNIQDNSITRLSTNCREYSRLAISNDGTLLAFETNESETEMIIVINTITKEKVSVIPGKNHDNVSTGVTGMNFSNDNNFLIFSTTFRSSIEIWNLNNKTLFYKYQYGQYPFMTGFFTLGVSRNNNYLISSAGQTLFLFRYRDTNSSKDDNNLINIYPNPATNIVNIQIKELREQELIVDINDMSGRLIKHIDNLVPDENGIIQIYVTDLSIGEYIIRVFEGGKILTYKLIINK